jgi:hypothetical protein
LLTTRTAAADLRLVTLDHDGHGTRYIKGGRVRMQTWTDDDPDLGIILEPATKSVWLVDDVQKTYFDVARLLKVARKKIAPYQPALRRAYGRTETIPVLYTPSHEHRTIHGFSCDMYTGFKDGRVVEEACVAPWGSPGVGPKKEYALTDAADEELRSLFMGTFLGLRAPRSKEPEDSPAHLPGLAVWTQVINEDRSRGTVMEIESVSHDSIPAQLFSVPADYREDEQIFDRHRTQGPARNGHWPIPDTAASSSGAATSGSRLTSIALFLLVVVFTLGLTFHALIVHLAAKFVLEEPRYMEALLATLLAWAVGVPLALLGAWLPVAAPLELLALYGGLRLSYRTSAGRTLALLIVSVLISLIVTAGLMFVRGAFR